MCDLNQELGRQRQKEFGIGQFTDSFDEMLSDPAIDAVAIYTPDPLHALHCRKALEAGKHVICTKPLFDSLDGARAVYDAWQASGCRFLVGQSSRWGEPMLRQWHDYQAGKLGEVWTVEAHYHHDHRHYMAHSWAAKAGIKWIFCGLSHPVDLVRRYFPDIEEVFGYGVQSNASKRLGQSGPDILHFVFKCQSGKIARVSGCYGLPTLVGDDQAMSGNTRDSLKSVIVRGEKGTTRADYPDLRYAYHFEGSPSGIETFENKRDYYYRYGGFSHHAGEFQNYLDAFAREIRGGEPAGPDLVEGIGTVAILQAMERSLEKIKPIKVADILSEYWLDGAIPGW
jgi:predicted dehydrogenase